MRSSSSGSSAVQAWTLSRVLYETAFRENDIDETILPNLAAEELKEPAPTGFNEVMDRRGNDDKPTRVDRPKSKQTYVGGRSCLGEGVFWPLLRQRLRRW